MAELGPLFPLPPRSAARSATQERCRELLPSRYINGSHTLLRHVWPNCGVVAQLFNLPLKHDCIPLHPPVRWSLKLLPALQGLIPSRKLTSRLFPGGKSHFPHLELVVWEGSKIRHLVMHTDFLGFQRALWFPENKIPAHLCPQPALPRTCTHLFVFQELYILRNSTTPQQLSFYSFQRTFVCIISLI